MPGTHDGGEMTTQHLGEGGWTCAMSDAVARRISVMAGGSSDVGEQFLADGGDMLGMGRDEYAQWFHRQMSTPGGDAAWEAHMAAVVAYRATQGVR